MSDPSDPLDNYGRFGNFYDVSSGTPNNRAHLRDMFTPVATVPLHVTNATDWLPQMASIGNLNLYGPSIVGGVANDDSKWHPGVRITWRNGVRVAYLHTGPTRAQSNMFENTWSVRSKTDIPLEEGSGPLPTLTFNPGALVFLDDYTIPTGRGPNEGMRPDQFVHNFSVNVEKVIENGYHRVRLEPMFPQAAGDSTARANLVTSSTLFNNFVNGQHGPYELTVSSAVVNSETTSYVIMNVDIRSGAVVQTRTGGDSDTATTTIRSGASGSTGLSGSGTLSTETKASLTMGADAELEVVLKLNGGDIIDMLWGALDSGPGEEGHEAGGTAYENRSEIDRVQTRRGQGGPVAEILNSTPEELEARAPGRRARVSGPATRGASTFGRLGQNLSRKNIYALLLELGEIKLTLGAQIAASLLSSIGFEGSVTAETELGTTFSVDNVREIVRSSSTSWTQEVRMQKTSSRTFIMKFEQEAVRPEDLDGYWISFSALFHTGAGARFLDGEKAAIAAAWNDGHSEIIKDAVRAGYVQTIELTGSASNLASPSNARYADERADALFDYFISLLGPERTQTALIDARTETHRVGTPGEESDDNSQAFRFAEIRIVLGPPRTP